METLTLRHTPDGWIARTDDPDVISLMGGTADLPTAYTERAKTMDVLNSIAALNPESLVILDAQTESWYIDGIIA